jgi:protein-S-isoprenylcysteine O-methyltransferase Ste14
MFLRWFLPVYLLIYFAAAFLWRSYLVWRRSGINPVTFKGANTTQDFIGRAFKIVFTIVVAVVVLNSFAPQVYWYTLPINSLEGTRTRSIGVGLLLLSLVWTAIAQAQMGESWRIGIDTAHRTPLVQSGVFGVSRNPIFLGMQVTLFGLFLVIPSAVTSSTLLSGIVLIGVQVRLEEEYLKKTHGEVYTEYCRSVRRWI